MLIVPFALGVAVYVLCRESSIRQYIVVRVHLVALTCEGSGGSGGRQVTVNGYECVMMFSSTPVV